MEVHHLPQLHHNPKPWKEYILEYIMIVLAVFTGFLAESLRENMGDREKEHQYMHSMIQDLKNDTAEHSKTIQYNEITEKGIDTLLDYVSVDLSDSSIYQLMAYTKYINYNFFAFRNQTTLSQLKNAGGFRFIKDTSVVNGIVKYDLFHTLIDATEQTCYKRKLDLRVNESELLDFSILKKLEKENQKNTRTTSSYS